MSSILVLALSFFLAPDSLQDKDTRKPPEKPHRLLALYVVAEPEDVPAGGESSLDAAVESVKRELEKEKDWFRMADDKQQAEVVVEITKEWIWRGTESYQEPGSSIWVPENRIAPSPHIQRQRLNVPDKHYIEAHLGLLGNRLTTLTASSENVDQPKTYSGSPEEKRRFAATDLARRVERLCRDNYWTLLDLELILSAWQGNATQAGALLEAGADAKAKDNDGVTALMWAVISNNPETVGVLLSAGADVNAKANDGSTAHLLAADNSKISEMLKKASARK